MHDHYLQAMQQMHLATPEANQKAGRRPLQAGDIEMDGRFGLAKAVAAHAVLQGVMYQWAPEDTAATADAVALARSAPDGCARRME